MNINFEALLHEYEALPSTQIEAKRLFSVGKTRAIVVAQTQSVGRGRHSREWASLSGGLYASFLLTPDISPSSLHLINMAASLAVRDFLRNNLNIPAIIKWPNDILVEGCEKKICGILCEGATENEKIRYCVVGVGVNLKRDAIPRELQDKACAVDDFLDGADKKELLFGIAEGIFSRLENLDCVLSEYRAKCATIGRDVKIESGGNIIFGRAVQIDDNGEIVVETKKGDVEKFNAADVFHSTLRQ